jgi:hypothetical protein
MTWDFIALDAEQGAFRAVAIGQLEQGPGNHDRLIAARALAGEVTWVQSDSDDGIDLVDGGHSS